MLSEPFAVAELLDAGALLICFITEITREARAVESTERENDAPFVLLIKVFFFHPIFCTGNSLFPTLWTSLPEPGGSASHSYATWGLKPKYADLLSKSQECSSELVTKL